MKNNHSARGETPRSPRQSQAIEVVELNVGGQVMAVSSSIIKKYPNCLLTRVLSNPVKDATILHDSQGRPFFDRDPTVFSLALDFLRRGGRFLPPGGVQRFHDWERLEAEAEYLQLPELTAQLQTQQRDAGGCSVEEMLEVLVDCVRDLQRAPASSSARSADAATTVAYLEVGETLQAVFLEGADPQRQLQLLGELGAIREVLRKRCNSLMPHLLERCDELSERRGRRLNEADIVGLNLPESELRERGFGGLDEFRLILLREVARVALPGPPTQVTTPNGEHRLLFRVASFGSSATASAD